MKTSHIPKNKNVEKITRLEAFNRMIRFSHYLGKIKIQLDTQGGPIWKFGVTIYPQYRQFELNFGKYLLNFWYRETTNPWWKIW